MHWCNDIKTLNFSHL